MMVSECFHSIVLPVIGYNNILVERNSQTVLQFDNTGTVSTAFCPPTPTTVSLSVLSLQKGPCVSQDSAL